MSKSIAHIDLDFCKYGAASVGEKRTVIVTHKPTGRQMEVGTRTEWHGHWKKRDGGLLAEINAKRDSPFSPDEFEFEDVQTPEPIENTLHTAKMMVESAVKASKATDVCFYIGDKSTLREERATILEYKGNRKDMIKPLALDEVSDYLTRKFKANVISGYEVDDIVVMESYGKPDHFVIGVDKDYYGTGSRFFNVNKPDEGIIDTRGFGSLWLDNKGSVKGKGRLFKLYQCCSMDNVDNYRANCASDIRWGEKAAYKALKDCKDDRQAFKAAVDVFKHLYPEPKEVVGWRGDTIQIDWFYVFQECFDMAHLHRWENDWVELNEVLYNLKLGETND